MATPHVVHAVAWYPPYSMGGSEVYVESLAAELARQGTVSSVLVPRLPGAPESYMHQGSRVETYPVNDRPLPGEIRAGRVHEGFEQYRALLERKRGAIFHQHAWTRGCGWHHLRLAREFGMRTVLTVHVPGNACLRGTMLRFGAVPCGGAVQASLCGACWAQERGAPEGLAHVLGHIPLSIAQRARTWPGRVGTALSARALAHEHLSALVRMAMHADRVVAVCQWLYDALAANGVPKERLVLCRQGLPSPQVENLRRCATSRRQAKAPLRLLFLGRCSPVKGLDLVVRAVRSLRRDIEVRLTIHALPPLPEHRTYDAEVRRLAGEDQRITVLGPATRAELPGILADHDVLVVPSQWLETGPLVVLEGQAAGLFILGSRRGGIAELVQEDAAGLLVEAGDLPAWADAIAQLARRHAAGGLPRSKRPVRTMESVATEMLDVYRHLTFDASSGHAHSAHG